MLRPSLTIPRSSIVITALRPMVVGLVFGLDPGCVYPSITTGWVIVGRTVSGLIVWTPVPGMLKLMVPPPMEFASVIACRNEPVPLSLVFVTVKTKGVVALCISGDSFATVASGSLALRRRVGRVERVVRNALPKVEASRIDEIDTTVTARVIRSAKARGEGFFFICSLG